MELSNQQRQAFHETLWGAYRDYGRSMLPWRQPEASGAFDPYKIMVSELMLQQTQVARVIPKYQAFVARFPTVITLADASLGDVLRLWQGLGYNRRAKFLWESAQAIAAQPAFPETITELTKLPGIGPNTAGAIIAYSFNRPVVFIETNIRTVYIHHFFHGQTNIRDTDIEAVVTQTVDHEQPREFYWALMDYGSQLKATIGNLNQASTHYAQQTRFHGSRRQIRGQVIRILSAHASAVAELSAAIPDERLDAVVAELVQEGLIRENNGHYSLE